MPFVHQQSLKLNFFFPPCSSKELNEFLAPPKNSRNIKETLKKEESALVLSKFRKKEREKNECSIQCLVIR